MKKSCKSNEDQYLVLLNICNIPPPGMDTSPTRRLLGRRTKTHQVPTTSHLLLSSGPSPRQESTILQKRQAKYYNLSAQDLPSLQEDETVRMKPFIDFMGKGYSHVPTRTAFMSDWGNWWHCILSKLSTSTKQTEMSNIDKSNDSLSKWCCWPTGPCWYTRCRPLW